MTTTNGILESFDIDGTLTLMCNFDGVPLPSLEWTHNGLLLSSSNNFITITTNRDQSYGTSMLQWVNASSDSVGTFTCVTTNSLGSANRSFIVHIRSKFGIFLIWFCCKYDLYGLSTLTYTNGIITHISCTAERNEKYCFFSSCG